MADSSSTSNSDRPSTRRDDRRAHGLPWALLLALAMVAGVELGVRQIDREKLVVTRGDADQARAVRDQIEVTGRVDVAFVGSSMIYQGINVPDLQSRLSAALGREIVVRNDAIRGGRMDVFAATVSHLLRQPVKPRVIVVGTSMRDLREYDLDLERMSLFWTVEDVAGIARSHGLRAAKYVPNVIRNTIEPHWVTLKYRNGLALMFERSFIEIATEPMPARGESPGQHVGSRRDQVLTMDEFKSTSNKRRMTQAYRIDLPAKPPEMFLRCVDEIIDQCRRSRVTVLFVDVPISEPMQSLVARADNTKRNTREIEPAYRAAMAERCARGGVPFLASDNLSLEWTLGDFYDSQHLNYAGATKFDAALAPLLARELAK